MRRCSLGKEQSPTGRSRKGLRVPVFQEELGKISGRTGLEENKA